MNRPEEELKSRIIKCLVGARGESGTPVYVTAKDISTAARNVGIALNERRCDELVSSLREEGKAIIGFDQRYAIAYEADELNQGIDELKAEISGKAVLLKQLEKARVNLRTDKEAFLKSPVAQAMKRELEAELV